MGVTNHLVNPQEIVIIQFFDDMLRLKYFDDCWVYMLSYIHVDFSPASFWDMSKSCEKKLNCLNILFKLPLLELLFPKFLQMFLWLTFLQWLFLKILDFVLSLRKFWVFLANLADDKAHSFDSWSVVPVEKSFLNLIEIEKPRC